MINMIENYHKRIQKVLSETYKNNTDKFLFGGKKKIEINHPTISRASITYYPDFVMITKQGHYYIFQILDSQEEHKDRTVANVIDAYLTEHVKKLYFIIQQEETKKEVKEIAKVILDKIEELSKEDTIRSKLHVSYIPIHEDADKNEIKDSLEKALLKIPKQIKKDLKLILEENITTSDSMETS